MSTIWLFAVGCVTCQDVIGTPHGRLLPKEERWVQRHYRQQHTMRWVKGDIPKTGKQLRDETLFAMDTIRKNWEEAA